MDKENRKRKKIVTERLAQYTRAMRASPGSPLAQLNRKAHDLTHQAFKVLDELIQRMNVVTPRDMREFNRLSDEQRDIMAAATKRLEENFGKLRTATYRFELDAVAFDAKLRALHAELNPTVVRLQQVSERMDLRAAMFKSLCDRLFNEELAPKTARKSRESGKDFAHFLIGRVPVLGPIWSGGRTIKKIVTRVADSEATARKYERELLEYCTQMQLWIDTANREIKKLH